MPIHRSAHHQRQAVQGSGDLQQNAQNHRDQKRLPALHQKVQEIREETHESEGPLLPVLQSEPRRRGDCGPVQTPLQVRQIQRAQSRGHQARWKPQEAVHHVLTLNTNASINL